MYTDMCVELTSCDNVLGKKNRQEVGNIRVVQLVQLYVYAYT